MSESDAVKEFTPEYREFLIKAYQKFIIPECLNWGGEYWRKVFEFREQETKDDGSPTWTAISPFMDTIKMWIEPKTVDPVTQTGHVIFFSTVQNCPLFWDAVLSYYLIRHPEIYESPKFVVKLFYAALTKAGANPQEIENFAPGILEWMDSILKGETTFMTIEQPFLQMFKMKWILWVATKYAPDVVASQDFHKNEAATKDVEEMKADIQTRIEAEFKGSRFLPSPPPPNQGKQEQDSESQS